VTQEQTTPKSRTQTILAQTRLAGSYYAILNLHPSASATEIRRAFRQLSKRYHPDTTTLPTAEATAKFQQLNEAYAILSNPEQRSLYDLKIGYFRRNVPQTPSDWEKPAAASQSRWTDSAYLDPKDRPLSAGEVFVLFILGVTFLGCLALAVLLAFLRGDPL
jgi:DnaJ-domain-containing protein 1